MSPFLGVAGLGGAGGNSRKLPPPEPYWISFSGISHWSNSENLTVDSSKNTFTWGKHSYLHTQGGIYSWWIVKFDSDGVPAWHRGIGGAGNEYITAQSNNITIGEGGNVYVVGQTDSTSGTNTGQYKGYILKYRGSSGQLLSRREVYFPTTQATTMSAVKYDGDYSGRILCSGYHNESTGNIGFLMSINPYVAATYVYQWCVDFNNMADVRDMVFDSSGNIYCTGRVGSLNQDEGFVMKLNSSGSIQWSTIFGNTGSIADYARSIVMDSSGNLYVAGHISNPYGGYTAHGFLAKFNSSGTHQWTKHIGKNEASSGYETQTEGMAIYDDKIYVGGFTQAQTYSHGTGFLIEFDTSGNQQWKRYFDRGSGSTGTCTVRGLDVDASGNLYVSLSQSIMDHVPNAGSKAHTVFKIPNDGTKTGTYTYTGRTAGTGFDFVYAASSISTGAYYNHSTSGLNNSSISVYSGTTLANAGFVTRLFDTYNLTEYYNASQNIGVDQTNMTGYHKIDIP